MLCSLCASLHLNFLYGWVREWNVLHCGCAQQEAAPSKQWRAEWVSGQPRPQTLAGPLAEEIPINALFL